MGARPGRSTQTALELLTQQVHTVWRSNPNLVASLLSLDISGAFDRVSHERMIHNMKAQAVPHWIVQFTKSFLKDRTTRLSIRGYMAQIIQTNTSIP